jgi:hypothetical protein
MRKQALTVLCLDGKITLVDFADYSFSETCGEVAEWPKAEDSNTELTFLLICASGKARRDLEIGLVLHLWRDRLILDVLCRERILFHGM